MKSFKEFKTTIAENRYMVKFEKGGSMKVREYEASSALAAESKARVDAKRMGMTVASVRLKEVEKKTKDSPAMDESTQIDEIHQEVSADFKVTASGKKVPARRKTFKDMDDEDEKEVKEELNKSDVPAYLRKKTGDKLTTQDLEKERTKNRSHPETIKKINGVEEGAVPAHMQGKQKPYVSSDGKGNYEVLGNKGQTKATFSRKEHGKDAHVKAQAHLRSKYDEYMKEETELDEAVDKQEQRFLQLARLGLVDKSDVSKLRIALDQLKADKPLTVPQRTMLLGVMSDLISLVTGDDTIFNRVKMDVQKESIEDLDENTEALKKKAEASGISLATLKTVYRRGVAAWNSGHRPGTTPQQWGMARVNSYVTKGKGTYHGADKDLREGGEPGEFNIDDIDEACWDTHTQVGMKKKGDKMVPNCVPKEEVKEDSRLDNKAYHKGVSDNTAQARVSHWKKMDKLSDRDPKAYEPAPGDATAKTTPSKHTKKYHAMYGEEVEIVEEDSIVVEEGYVSLAQQRAVWATRKDGGKGHPDNKKKEKKEETEPPFDPDPPKKNPDAKAGKYGQGYSTARHLARLALQKQQQKKTQNK